MNWFSIAVIVLFTAAGLIEFSAHNIAKASFYWLSAAINVSAIFMR